MRTNLEYFQRSLSVSLLFEQSAESEVGVAPAAGHSEPKPSNRVVHPPRSRGESTHVVLCSRQTRISREPEPQLHHARTGLVFCIPEPHFVRGLRVTGLRSHQQIGRWRGLGWIVGARTGNASEQSRQ